MFITIGWIAQAGTNAHDVEGEIFASIESLEFANYFIPYDGLFVANIRKNETRMQVQLLHNLLWPLSANRFSYLIGTTPNAWSLPSSADWVAVCSKTANYQT